MVNATRSIRIDQRIFEFYARLEMRIVAFFGQSSRLA